MGATTRWIAATDFSESGDRAAELAVVWAGRLGAELVGAHAAPELGDATPPSAQPLIAQNVEADRREAGERLDPWAEAARAAGISVEVRLVPTPAWKGIVELARSTRADCIVVGTHGASGVHRSLLGSTAERIVRHAPCSVLAVRGETSAAIPERIILGEDLLSVSESARARAIELAREFEARIDVVHAVDLGTPYLSALELTLPRQVLESVTDEARQRLDQLAAENRDVAIENVVVDDKPAQALCDRAERTRAGLVVLGSHGLGGVARLVLGSVAEQVVRHAPCSVLVVR